jgi:glutamine synthetase type III
MTNLTTTIENRKEMNENKIVILIEEFGVKKYYNSSRREVSSLHYSHNPKL